MEKAGAVRLFVMKTMAEKFKRDTRKNGFCRYGTRGGAETRGEVVPDEFFGEWVKRLSSPGFKEYVDSLSQDGYIEFYDTKATDIFYEITPLGWEFILGWDAGAQRLPAGF